MIEWIIWLVGIFCLLGGISLLLTTVFYDSKWKLKETKFEYVNNINAVASLILIYIGTLITKYAFFSGVISLAVIIYLFYKAYKNNTKESIKKFFTEFSSVSVVNERKFFLLFILSLLIILGNYSSVDKNMTSENKSKSKEVAKKSTNKKSDKKSDKKSTPSKIRYIIGSNGCPLKNGSEYASSPGYAAGEIFRITANENFGDLNRARSSCQNCATYSRNEALKAGINVNGMGPMWDKCFDLFQSYSANPTAWNALRDK